MNNLGIIIQARTGSTRLPQKMVLPFYNKQGILDVLISRLQAAGFGNKIIIATTSNDRDNVINEIAKQKNVHCYRGDENDVLARFIGAARKYEVSKIIRICADNPFLDMKSLQALIESGIESDYEYVSFCTSSNIPTIKTHFGFWAEYTTLNTLERVALSTKEKTDHEHVTIYIYTHPNDFKLKLIPINPTLESKTIRLTIDTLTDFRIQQEIFRHIYDAKPNFGISDVIEYLDLHSNLYEIMNNIIQQNKK